MNIENLLGSVIRGALGGRRKRSRRASRYLAGGRGSFLNTSTILAAAGVAWGMWETYQRKTGGFAGPGAPSTRAGPPPSTGDPSAGIPRAGAPAAPARTPPDVDPAVVPSGQPAAHVPAPDAFPRFISLAICAARADGVLGEDERAHILEQARAAGVEALVQSELDHPRPIAEILAGVSDPDVKRELYVISFGIVRADESVSGAERIFLAQVAHQLGLDSGTVARLERETAAAIDATPEGA
jgi:uncharacterized membrane protein YebE (DUF533 family)